MTEVRCVQCDARGARHVTTTGRALCDDCHRLLVGLAGAGTAAAGGGGMGEAMTTGFGAAAHANAVADERTAGQRRRDKLAVTGGFWRRWWVRVVG